MEVGLRVVRGPDWKWQDQDGGEGHVGTVVEVGTRHNNIPSQTVVVQWHSGFRANYRIGFHGAYDLRVFDSGPVGVKHVKEVCNVCKKKDIPGGRWKCLQCNNFNLCQHCYMSDQHDIHHSFLRFDSFNSVEVPMRNTSRKIESSGIFPGAIVVRGPNWKWGDQDGGEGTQGTVRDCDGESNTDFVKVSWTSGQTNVYRLGHLGKVDLMCVRAVSGGSYYPDHLPILGQAAESSLCATGHVTYKPGDHVKVCIDIDTLKDMQEGHGGWNPLMAKYRGKVGKVHRVTETGDIRVQYDGCSNRWTLNARSLTKVEPELTTTTSGRDSEIEATTTLGWNCETEASVVGSSTVSNPRQLPGNTAACGQTVAERLAAVGPTVVSDPVTTWLRTQEPVATMSTSAKAEVSRTTDVAMTDVQPPVAEITTPPSVPEMRWTAKSERHKEKLSQLIQLEKTCLVDLKQFHMSSNGDFKIGTGSYGAVFLGFVRNDLREVAVKRVQNIDDNIKMTRNEVEILVKVQDHPNIVSYRMVDYDKEFTYIACQLCDYTVEEWLKEGGLHPPGDWGATAAGLTKDLMCGLDFLHSQKPKILHRDIKPKNVFVVHRNGWQVKLADFGISRSLDEDESTLLTGPAGTRCWKAKEVIECRPGEPVRYKPSTDIQPAGMVIFFILTKGKHPYALDEKYHKVESRIADNEPDLSAVDDPVACDMLTNMLAADPTERPSAMELLRHPFFWDEDKRYQFLASVGNQPEVANSHDAAHVNSHVRVFIEATKVDIIPKGDWKDVATKLNQLGKRFQKDFNKQLFTESICKLLRTMRNIQDHYDEQSPGAKADLGNTCYPYGFFNSELPLLFIRTYNVIKQSTGKPDDWTEREQLKGYFSHPS